ncbi:histidine kinase [Halomarina ordinaria]|uniref:Histidine kinase n=1 Tax=Halomarina ordinaria TaxID=3033939 RepID=A0ABD5UD42_9EURY|nr:histidine kinase [Halomarina sp. PSRA2]
MSQQVRTETPVQQPTNDAWRAGVLAGILAGAVMGVLLTVQMTPVIEVAIPSLYGLEGGLAGWVVHVAHGAVLGVGFAALVRAAGVETTVARSLALGLAYGVVLWVVLAVLVMPVWLGAVGAPMVPPLPNVDPMSLVGHLVYGAVLGASYPLFAR